MKKPTGLIAAGTLVTAALAAIHIPLAAPVVLYTGAFVASSAFFLLLAWTLMRTDLSRTTVLLFVVLALLLRISFLTTPPIGSDDLYRYMWDGKVQMNGINPYRYPPNAEELRNLRTPLLPSRINHPEMPTPYFPLDQWLFAASSAFSGEAVWGFKLLLLLAEIVTIGGLFLLLRQVQQPEKFILLYALCPLPIIAFAVDAHLDGFGLPLMVFSLLAACRGRKVLSLVLLALSISIKPVAIVALPILFFLETRTADRARVLIIPGLVVLAQFVPYLGGAGPWEPLVALTKHWAFNGSVFTLFYTLLGDNQQARLICGILLAVALALLAARKPAMLPGISVALFFLLILSPVVHPWYVAWLAVLLPVLPRWSGLVLTSTASLTAFTVLTFATTGVWKEYPALVLLEYLPPVLFFLREAFGRGWLAARPA